MKNKISASLMCADPFNLKDTIILLEKYNVNYLHIDIMDGKFVPNLGILQFLSIITLWLKSRMIL